MASMNLTPEVCGRRRLISWSEFSAARTAFQFALKTAGGIANKDAEANALLHFGDFEYRAGHAASAREM
jgi:hypothetical protein